ncbi:hypothetical protein M0208_05865 [Sphingomonas sp. SUN019]|uniref:hypothetical protein n=1 Tax=Sphingomonas sp. SUN019 TaxID=2937788 RepID=UPI0021649973|nr:hypothetical protein [Sphingomonas sp. SUN019]UVO50068.1 hypothetical protein M0208_05865 [Sphingomonas sp. SUN019]
MRIATTASVALLALSTAALAQVASPHHGSDTMQNNTSSSNMTMPDTMTNNSATPDNGAVPPGE